MELKISSKPENITEVEKFAEGVRQSFNINDEIYGNILVVLTEAVNNAIVHGNKLDASKDVEIFLLQNDNSLTFTVKDQGNGFDYTSLPDPTAPENLEKPTGRGVFLMKHLSDLIVFSEEGSIVELQFRI